MTAAPSFYGKAGLLHETKKVGKVRGLFLQSGENSQPHLLLGRGRLFPDPLAIVKKAAPLLCWRGF